MSLSVLPALGERTPTTVAEAWDAALEAAARLKDADARNHRRIATNCPYLAADAISMAEVCESDAFRIRALKGGLT